MVYVDNFRAPYRRMIMCHMVADTRQELFEMVDKIGVQRKWIQEFDTRREHFDICLKKKKLAIELGAKEINMRELATMTTNRNMDDYLKVKYIQITHEGSRAVQTIDDAKSFVESIEEGEVYAFRSVFLTEEEFNNLPEFTGF